MPKYIRTKDGRIVDFSQCKVCEHLVGKPLSPKRGHLIYPEDIIKQADTIEELCDEFVVQSWTENQKPIYVSKIGNILRFINEQGVYEYWLPDLLKMGIKIYGAIWTEWGLKYVAKMNDKGELELL